MIQYSTTLKNPYYFLTDNVLFAIGNLQDEDKCGKKLVSYKQTLDKDNTPITIDVKKGEKYMDEHHEMETATSDKTVNVYGNELNHTACSSVFPHFSVTYQYVNGEENGEPETVTVVMNYYLQGMISVGDKYTNGKFVRNNEHSKTGDTNYLTEFQNSIKEDIAKYVEKGYSLDEIKKTIPHWYFASNIDHNFDVNGKKMTLKSVSDDITQITDEVLMTEIYKKINEMSVSFSNKKLETYGKKLKTESETIVTDNTVQTL